MIVTDVNLLVYAYRPESDRHDAAAAWLARTLPNEDFALTDLALAGFLRLVTNSRIFSDPAPTAHALTFIEAIAAANRARWIAPTRATWRVVRELVELDRGLVGNLIPDTVLAALTIANGGRLATCDRGFARFHGLDWFDPITP